MLLFYNRNGDFSDDLIATLRTPADLTNDIVRPLLAIGRAAVYHEPGLWEDLGTWPRYLTHLIAHQRRRRD